MSDNSNASSPPPGDAPKPISDPASSPAPRAAKKRGRWRRRIIWTLSVLVGLFVLFRVAIIFILPPVLRSVAGRFDLTAGYDRMELYFLDGDVGLWHLKFAPKNGGEPILTTDYCRANISTFNLLQGKLVVYRAEADGVDLLVDRAADGSIPLLQRFVSKPNAATSTAALPTPSSSNAGPTTIDLTAPVRVDALRLQRIRAQVRDMSINPPLDARFDLNLRLTNLAGLTGSTKFEMDLSSSPLLDALRIEGEGTSHGQTLDANLNVMVRGIHLKPAAGYLSPLGIRPVADDLSLRMTGHIKTDPVPAPANAPVAKNGQPAPAPAIKARLVLDGIAATTDGQVALALDELTLEADAITTIGAQLSRLVIEGARCNAHRTADGAIWLAGLEYDPNAPRAAATPDAPRPSAASPTTRPAGSIFRWSLAELNVNKARATFRDYAITPNTELAFLVNQFIIKNIVADPDHPDEPADLSADMSAPGIIGAIHLAGTVKPFAQKKTLDLTVRADQIHPDAIKPYFDRIGIESELEQGTFACALAASTELGENGKIAADMKLHDVRYADGADLLALNQVNVAGVALDPSANRIRVESIDIAGPRLSARRDATGVFAALGLRTKQIPSSPPAAPTSSRANAPAIAPSTKSLAVSPQIHPTSQPSIILPSVEIARFTWSGLNLRIDDAAVAPASKLELKDVGVELTDVAVNFDPHAPPGKTGKLRAWLDAPGLLGKFAATGTIVPRANGTTLDLSVLGDGITAASAAPYLKSMGIEPVLSNGSIKLSTQIDIKQTDGALGASLSVEKLMFLDNGGELAGIDSLSVRDVWLRSHEIEVGSVEVNRPRLRASRAANGEFGAVGFRTLLNQLASAPAQALDPSAVLASTTAPATRPAAPAESMVAILRSLRVKGATLQWTDAAAPQPADMTAIADVALDGFVFGRKSDPARLQLGVRVPETIDEATVSGTLSAAPNAASAKLDIAAKGIKQGKLAAYLPPGVKIGLRDGRFRTRIDAAIGQNPAGGQTAHLIATDLDYRDGADGPPLLQFTSAKATVARFDPPGKRIDVEEISLKDFSSEIHKTTTGDISALGLTLGTAPPATQPASPSPAVAPLPPSSAPASSPLAPSPSPLSSSSSPDLTKAAAAKALERLPLITLNKLDVNLKRVAMIDDAHPDAVPLAIAELHLGNPKPLEMLGDDPTAHDPLEFAMDCKIDPLVDSFTIKAQAVPFSSDASLRVDLAAAGVRGDGVTQVLPELKTQLDGSRLADGRFATHFEATMKLPRRGLIDFDPSKPMDLELLLKGTEFRAEPSGPVLAGLEELRSEGIHIDPATSNVAIKSVELTKPIGNVLRDADGIHVLGMIVKLPTAAAPATQPVEQATAQPVEQAAAQPAPPPATPAAKPAGEITINKLLINGIDFQIEDRATDPVTLVILNGLDVEVRDISSLAPFEDKPIRFNALVNAGKVPMPRREKNAGGFGGQKESSATTLPDTEDRELFAQAAASGKISLYPAPKGWAKASLSGLELIALRGEAKQAKVELNGGIFDTTCDVRFAGDGSLVVRPKFIFTDLSLSEAPDGPIRRTLKLPQPVDAIIGIMQDADGSITVPLDVPVKNGNLSTGAVVGSAVGAMGVVVATAIASAPIKVTQGVGEIFGLGGDKDGKKAAEVPLLLAFSPGDTSIDGSTLRELDPLLKRLRQDKSLEVTMTNILGRGDLGLASTRANPSPGDCRDLAYRLRARKMELLARRAELAGQARGELAALGSDGAGTTIEQLRATDRQIAAIENAMDQVYELLRPGADRQAVRRTRAASLLIANSRLESVRSALVSSGIPGIDQRVKLIRPKPAAGDLEDGGQVSLLVSKAPKK